MKKNRSNLCLAAAFAAIWLSACVVEPDDPPSTGEAVIIKQQTFSNKQVHWTNHNKEGADYIIEERAFFQSNSTLIIDPGVEVVFKNSARLEFSNATLKAIGTASERILFRGESPAPGFWGCIDLHGHTDHEMAYCTISGAGGSGGSGTQKASLLVGTALNDTGLSLQNCEIRNGANYGLYIHLKSSLSQFSNNVITDCDYPAYVRANSLGQLAGTGNSLTGHKNNQIIVNGSDVERSSVWPNLGLTYLFNSETELQQTVTIEPGCKLMFDIGSNFKVYKDGVATGKLFALGTASEPIIFGGQIATKGYWKGIDIKAGEAQLRHCQVSDAGKVGPSSANFGSISCTQALSPVLVTVTQCTISNSSGHGFSIQNAAASSVTLTNNVFTGITGENIKYY